MKVNPLTYFLILSFLLCGYFKYLLIITFILFIHDLGHVIIIKKLGYKITNIEILPFGGNIKTNLGLNSDSKDILLISIAGVIAQFMLLIIIFFLTKLNLIDYHSYNVFLKYNLLIMFFNLLPIYPLDGSKIASSFLEMFFSFSKTLIISYGLSFIFILIFCILNYIYNFDNYLMISFLFCKLILYIKEHKFILNKFYVERYLSKKEYKKVKFIKRIKDIHKNYHNFINNESEDKLLEKKLKYFI